MKSNTILKYMRMHNKEVKKFKERYREEPNVERGVDGNYLCSSRKEVNLNGLVFVYKGFKNNGYNPCFITCAYNKNYEPVVQFNTFFSHTYREQEITESLKNLDNKMSSEYFRISYKTNMFLAGEMRDLSNLISKDEYFNLSLQYELCPYELYLLGIKLNSSISNTVEILITPKLLEL
ncbi:hypothetical protein XaC1_128 [Xanthomonas phage XaC1]|nr:hypothetical protein XaC1_128 [Xanthomonas phage XaC1]